MRRHCKKNRINNSALYVPCDISVDLAFYHVLNLLSVLECFAFDSIRPISLTYLYLLTTFSLLQTRFLASLLPLQFKEKASAYFNADGSLNNLSPQDYRERLLGTLDKYRETLEGHNKSVAELRERVDETKAAEMLAEAETKIDDMVNGTFPFEGRRGGFGGRGFGPGPHGDNAPGDTDTAA